MNSLQSAYAAAEPSARRSVSVERDRRCLEAFGEVCHRTRGQGKASTAPYHRLSLNAEGGGANGHARFTQPLRAARRYLQHCDRRRRPHRSRNGRPTAHSTFLFERWQMSDDRRKWRRVGVIVPSPNTTVEADFMRALPANVTVHAARMYLAETTADAERRMIYDRVPIAVTDLATLRPHVVAFACTSAGAVLGADGEAALIANIARETGAFVVSTNNAVGKAIETL